MRFINYYKEGETMCKCPVCENETDNGICPICGYELENDIRLNKLSRLLSIEEIKKYYEKIDILKDIYHQNNINYLGKNEVVSSNNVDINDVDELLELAENYRFGLDQDYNLVVKYYQYAAELGSREAMEELGRIYEEGNEVVRDINKAVEYYQQAAKLDSIVALYNLAKLYYQGNGVEKNIEKAIEYYQRLSMLHSDEPLSDFYLQRAVITLADIYYEQKNYLRAKNYYVQAFSRWKNREAASRLAIIYKYGLGVVKDKSKAKEYANIMWKL